MKKHRKAFARPKIKEAGSKPSLDVCKIGIVTRDYRIKFPNGYRDFSHSLPKVLKVLDDHRCDTVLFSLFSIVPREGYDPRRAFNGLENVRAILLEEFQDGESREAGNYVVYYRGSSNWEEYKFQQIFGTLGEMSREEEEMHNFVENEIPKRILGNCCVLLCGETNGVKYSRKDKKVHDTFGLRRAIPKNVNVVLNPIHDRMIRPEMKWKRQFLSESNRWVISVWNKGRLFGDGKTRDGNKPAWTVFYNGNDKKSEVEVIQNDFEKMEIGVLDIERG